MTGMQDVQTLYQVLEIPESASPEEIHSAFLKLAQQYHPDKLHHLPEHLDRLRKDAQEKFKEIKEAWDKLSDPAERKKYDEALRQLRGLSPQSAEPVFDSYTPPPSPPPTSPPPHSYTTSPVTTTTTPKPPVRIRYIVATGVLAVLISVGRWASNREQATRENRDPALYCYYHDCSDCDHSKIVLSPANPTVVFELQRTCTKFVMIPSRYSYEFDNDMAAGDYGLVVSYADNQGTITKRPILAHQQPQLGSAGLRGNFFELRFSGLGPLRIVSQVPTTGADDHRGSKATTDERQAGSTSGQPLQGAVSVNDRVNRLLAQAERQFREGEYKLARQSCEAALQLDQSNADAKQLKARIDETMRVLGIPR